MLMSPPIGSRSAIVEEIMKVVNDHVKAANYDIVFDRNGLSANNIVPVLLYRGTTTISAIQ